ncbi:DUF2637 domain-containing protein [Dactylosporangium sp. NBC_01737]|uniref:DUF2637 domain-containing protein n=1 Tax=Dactylosporangium sp. NBC_01737 TaxID=2975959 RepID=UPI002E1065E1|nr:DUF2637 domain-containing protein [Dactylosporangium sp. NBC_01737]
MNARRFASIAGTVAVTVIAAVGSYDHQRELALIAGQTPLLATLLPLSVDGMLLVATLALGDGRRSRWSAWLAFLIGVTASLAANVMVADPNPVARVVSAWPALALLLTVEILTRSGKAPEEVPQPVRPVAAQPVEAPTEAPESAAQPPELPAEPAAHQRRTQGAYGEPEAEASTGRRDSAPGGSHAVRTSEHHPGGSSRPAVRNPPLPP